ncbi:MAG: hypothetical protein GX159_02920 [Flavobacteriaceae bacterium]|jgi:hypothetical protein|nr:hypothetical protein [Flavobacteriaceae bacterium]
MKKKFILIVFLLSVICNSQDVIIMKNGDEIQSKVSEINIEQIKYKKFDSPDGPVYIIPKSDVLLIQYENGEKDIFTNKEPEVSNIESPSNEDLFSLGERDASKYYKGYRGAGTGTLITSLVSPLIGLIPAISTSSTQPKIENLNYPNEELFKNSQYYEGYTKKAKKIKQGRVWMNWGIAFGVNLVAVLFLLSSAY